MELTHLLVKKILEKANAYDWSLQGFGMLRLYLDKNTRLHVWHNKYMVPNVSLLHTHPWNFTSRIICGSLFNEIYEEVDGPFTHTGALLKCGEKTAILEEPRHYHLRRKSYGQLGSGDSYAQKHNEIHQTVYSDGTVTIVNREVPPGGNPDHAKVFWPFGTNFVSAEPRPASAVEVLDFVTPALAKLREMEKLS